MGKVMNPGTPAPACARRPLPRRALLGAASLLWAALAAGCSFADFGGDKAPAASADAGAPGNAASPPSAGGGLEPLPPGATPPPSTPAPAPVAAGCASDTGCAAPVVSAPAPTGPASSYTLIFAPTEGLVLNGLSAVGSGADALFGWRTCSDQAGYAADGCLSYAASPARTEGEIFAETAFASAPRLPFVIDAQGALQLRSLPGSSFVLLTLTEANGTRRQRLAADDDTAALMMAQAGASGGVEAIAFGSSPRP